MRWKLTWCEGWEKQVGWDKNRQRDLKKEQRKWLDKVYEESPIKHSLVIISTTWYTDFTEKDRRQHLQPKTQNLRGQHTVHSDCPDYILETALNCQLK